MKKHSTVKGTKPQLTSLIDVMTILLIYLLKSFSSEGEIITLSKNLMLPESSSRQKPKLTLVITVNNEYILAEGKKICHVSTVLSSSSYIIPELFEYLKKRRSITQNIEKFSSDTKFSGEVTIQGDKAIQFKLLKKIMYTCGQQKYNNFFLAVRKQEV